MADYHGGFLKVYWIINWRLYLRDRSLIMMIFSKSVMGSLWYGSCQMSNGFIVYKVFLGSRRNNSGEGTFLYNLWMTYWVLKLFYVHRSSHWKAWVEVTLFSLRNIELCVWIFNIKRLRYWLRLIRLILSRLVSWGFLCPLLVDDFHSASPPFFIVFVDTIKF